MLYSTVTVLIKCPWTVPLKGGRRVRSGWGGRSTVSEARMEEEEEMNTEERG